MKSKNQQNRRICWSTVLTYCACLLFACLTIPPFLTSYTPSLSTRSARHNIRSASPQEAASSTTSSSTTSVASSAATASSTGVLNVFQVSTPVVQPQGRINDDSIDTSVNTTTSTASDEGCRVTLMTFTFANSFGKPFVGMQPLLSLQLLILTAFQEIINHQPVLTTPIP
jgi:hypothetical protein